MVKTLVISIEQKGKCGGGAKEKSYTLCKVRCAWGIRFLSIVRNDKWNYGFFCFRFDSTTPGRFFTGTTDRVVVVPFGALAISFALAIENM